MQEILGDEKKRQKLVIYINPPYAEASTTSTRNGTGQNKTAVADTRIAKKYWDELGGVRKELYAQFFMRIYQEINGCILAGFSTLKYINAQQSETFRKTFKAKFLDGFISPSYTFDNVRGSFPIGFLIWDTKTKKELGSVALSVFNDANRYLESKTFYADLDSQQNTMVKWLRNFYDKNNDSLAFLRMIGSDFQNNQGVFFANRLTDNDIKKHLFTQITKQNIIPMCMYLAIRHIIEATWINDRDQFYTPNSLWEEDKEFQSDCLAFALFHGQNKISSQNGTNHFIPFTESEIGAKSAFESDFMTRFIGGKVKLEGRHDSLFENKGKSEKLNFSYEAKMVFDAGRKVFAYYHSQDFSTKPYNVNASFYDIKEFFQGRNAKGEMNKTHQAKDTHYKDLMAELADSLNTLAKKLKPKIYEYGFLKE